MTDAPALPAMFTASVAPVVAEIQLFACDQGDESGLDELPPEAMALLFAAMLGVQVAGSPAKAAPGPTSIVTGSADRTAAPGAAAPAAAAAGSAADSARALEAILRDLLLPGAAANRSELPADETVAGTDAAPAGPDAASLKVVLNGMPGAIDVPTARSPAHDPLFGGDRFSFDPAEVVLRRTDFQHPLSSDRQIAEDLDAIAFGKHRLDPLIVFAEFAADARRDVETDDLPLIGAGDLPHGIGRNEIKTSGRGSDHAPSAQLLPMDAHLLAAMQARRFKVRLARSAAHNGIFLHYLGFIRLDRAITETCNEHQCCGH